jgi:hypothetical protein
MSDVVKHDLSETFARQLFVAEHGHTGLTWDQVDHSYWERLAARFLEGWWDPATPFVVLDLATGEMWLSAAPPSAAPGPSLPSSTSPTRAEFSRLTGTDEA